MRNVKFQGGILKKTGIIIAIILVVSVIGAYFYFSGKEYIFRFSENQIHEKLSQKLPLTEKYLFIFEVTLDNPRVTLNNGSDRVIAGLDIILNIWVGKNPQPLGGSIDASGGVKYVSEKGEFFLTDPVVERFAIQGIPEQYSKKVNKVLTKALNEYYETHPIYKLNPTDAKQVAARLILKNVIIENQQLVVTLGI